ncbi:MAG: hypothetical protein II168_05155 [Ruminococcus sp.]|nr:hypothetical protein [Ruminococcus sp.]
MLQGLFEQMALVLLGGVCASAFLASLIFIRALGIGEGPVISPIIGAAAGIGLLLISPTNLGVVAIVAAAVITIIAAIVIDKLFYQSGKDLAKPSENQTAQNTQPMQPPQPVQLVDKAQENADWECVGCHKINKPDAKFCRYCGTKKPEAAPVKAYFTPAVQSNVTYKTGNPMKVIFFIVAAVGIIANLLMLSSVSSHKDSLKELVDKNYYYTLNKIEYDFTGYAFYLLIVGAVTYVAMAAFRKKFIGLACSFAGVLFAVLFAVNSSGLIKQLNVKMTLPIVALAGAFVLSVLYCIFDKLWIGILNICASGGAVFLLLDAVNKANIRYREPTLPWLNLCGNAALMLMLAMAVRRDQPQKPENSAAAAN